MKTVIDVATIAQTNKSGNFDFSVDLPKALQLFMDIKNNIESGVWICTEVTQTTVVKDQDFPIKTISISHAERNHSG